MDPAKSAKVVTVYCGSTENISQRYKKDAFVIGQLIAQEGWIQRNGGGEVGLMGACTRGALSASGVVECVTLDMFVEGPMPSYFCNPKVVPTMVERKAGLRENADAFVALPGGLGTLDELTDVLCGRQLSFHQCPIVLMNTDGYFDAFVQFVKVAIAQNFVSEDVLRAMFVSDTPQEAIEFLKNYRPFEIDKSRLESTEMKAASANK